jgi:WD40 repeat protein
MLDSNSTKLFISYAHADGAELARHLQRTTRDTSIASAVGAREFTANLLTDEQSRALLAQWSGRNTSALPAEADDLIRECGRLPLALSMIGATLRDEGPAYWKDILNLMHRSELASIQAQFPHYPHPTLFRAIQVSVDQLDAGSRERYFALAVLLEDMTAELPVLQTLWNAGESEARRFAKDLASRSLATRAGDAGAIGLHDLQLDYIRAQSPLRESLPLIHGALRLSAHVVSRDPHQFASQLQGRLLPYQIDPPVGNFLASITEAAPRPWLCPLHPGLSPPGGALIRTLAGHSDSVNGVALSADGRRAVSTSWDHTLKVWDVDTGREIPTFAGHSDIVHKVALSADGRYAVSASSDNMLKILDFHSGREVRTLSGHINIVTSRSIQVNRRGREVRTFMSPVVALSADGRRAAASDDQTLKVWDVDSGREVCILTGHTGSVYGVALSADGRRAVSGSDDQTLKVWDLDSGREVRTLAGHSDSVNDVALSADGRRAVSASSDNILMVWDLDSRTALNSLATHTDAVRGVALSQDGRRAISASTDCTLKVWDADTGREVRTLAGHAEPVTEVALSADGRRAVSSSTDCTLKVWDTDSGSELRTLEGHSSSTFTGVALSADGQCVIFASGDTTVKVWNLEMGREIVRTLTGHSDRVNGVALSADGRWAVSASRDTTLKVWDLEAGREIRTLTGHSRSVDRVALSADGRHAVSASWDKTLKVWDLEAGREIRTLTGHSRSVDRVALSADGRRAVSASMDKTLNVWDLETGDVIATFTCDAGALCCAWSGSGLIVAGDELGRVHFLSLEL